MLQAEAKLLRRLTCVLRSAPADKYLQGLEVQFVRERNTAVTAALREVALAHQVLRSGFNDSIAEDGWAAIQEAFTLAHQLGTRKVRRLPDCRSQMQAWPRALTVHWGHLYYHTSYFAAKSSTSMWPRTSDLRRSLTWQVGVL